MSTLGQLIREKRKARRWTQYDLAAEIGVRRPTVARWESDLCVPKPRYVLRLAALFSIDVLTLCAQDMTP